MNDEPSLFALIFVETVLADESSAKESDSLPGIDPVGEIEGQFHVFKFSAKRGHVRIVGLMFWGSFIAASGLWTNLKVILFGASICGGAWVGVRIHSIVGAMLTEPAPPTTPPVSPANQIIQCPRCTQKLRLPSVLGRVRITCTSCKHGFFHNSTGT